MHEYPKVIFARGLTLTVNNAEEEAGWLGTVAPAEPLTEPPAALVDAPITKPTAHVSKKATTAAKSTKRTKKT